MHKYNPLIFALLACLMATLFIIDLLTGSVDISLQDVRDAIAGNNTGAATILYSFRLPKACAAVFTGIALSVSGLQMQTVFRNPLADPYVLGVSSGAGLGVALFIMGASALAFAEPLRNLGTYAAALAGSAAALAIILFVSARVKDIMSVLILGVMFGSGISAIISILQYFSASAGVKAYVIWTMGSLGAVAPDKLPLMGAALVAGTVLSVYAIKPLNVLLLGEHYAKSTGVNIRRSRNIVFLATSILTGTATAFCGPVGFIGIAVPHLTRILFRQADHRILMPGTMLIGPCVMLLCDVLSQCIVRDVSLPINSITALLGIPVIITVIAGYSKRRR
ncbi:MAG: iron ABC transporter permease [Prevotellaceae bacterium]|nr:iron ABC transporter permease [Prevotellaceae bacterium]